MDKFKNILKLLTVFTLLLGGCSSVSLQSAMIQYTPQNHMTKRTSDELRDEVNRLLPFNVREDDFLSTHSVEGHSCWIILEDRDNVKTVTAAIKRAQDYKYITVGYFNPQYRSIFGFKNRPEQK